MKNLFEIIWKDFKILGRSKFSLLILLLVPLLVVVLVGNAFNSSSYAGINIGTYSEGYSSLSSSIIDSFINESYNVERFEAQEDCINAVKSNRVHVCIIFPKDLSTEGNSEEVNFYVDNSRVNLAYALIQKVNSEISSKASELGETLAQDLIDALVFVKNNLPTEKTDVSNSLSDVRFIKSKASEAKENSLDLSGALAKLNEAKTTAEAMNDSDEKDDILASIKDAISNIETLESSSSTVDKNIGDIQTKSEDMEVTLNSVISSLEGLIEGVNAVNVLDAEKVVSPIRTEVNSVTSNKNNLDFLLPTLFSLVILFGSILLASTLVLREKKTKAYFRNFITPTSDFVFILGTYLTSLLILIIQFLLVFIGTKWLMKMNFISNWSVVLILFISSAVFIFLGMLIGYFFKSEETVIFTAISVASILMFFSNTILPIEAISGKLKFLAEFNPLVLTSSALKQIMLFNRGLGAVSFELYLLIGGIVIFAVLTFFARKITKRML